MNRTAAFCDDLRRQKVSQPYPRSRRELRATNRFCYRRRDQQPHQRDNQARRRRRCRKTRLVPDRKEEIQRNELCSLEKRGSRLSLNSSIVGGEFLHELFSGNCWREKNIRNRQIETKEKAAPNPRSIRNKPCNVLRGRSDSGADSQA